MTEFEKIKDAEVETYKRMYLEAKEENKRLRELVLTKTKKLEIDMSPKHSCI